MQVSSDILCNFAQYFQTFGFSVLQEIQIQEFLIRVNFLNVGCKKLNEERSLESHFKEFLFKKPNSDFQIF